eukprot:scaffold32362_cov50-Phaeocystis_antarctica.AAC.4
MYGTIEVPEPFYDYEKKDKAAAVAARWALKTAERAAVEAKNKAAKQAAVQQANTEAAAKAARAAVKAATKRAAKKTEKNAAAEQSEEKTEKAAGDKTIKQEVAVQVRHDTALGAVSHRPAESLYREARALSPLEHDPCIHASGVELSRKAYMAPGPRNAFRNCCL